MLWMLVVFAVAMSVAVALIGRRLPLLIQYAFFLRFPLLMALVILLLPRFESEWIPGTFNLSYPEVLAVTPFVMSAAWACMITGMVIAESAPRRFGVPRLALPSWMLRLRLAIASSLALPMLVRMELANDNLGLSALYLGAGIAIALASLLVLTMARQLITPPDVPSNLLLSQRWVPKFVQNTYAISWLTRMVLPPDRLRRVPRALGAGYIDYSSGRVLPGPAWILVLLGATMTGCIVSNHHIAWLIANGRPVTLFPTIAYIAIGITMLTLFLVSLSFFFDRYRVPVVLVAMLWFAMPYLGSHSGNFFTITHASCTKAADEASGLDCSVPADIQTAIDPWLKEEEARAPGQKPTLVVVSASGGGVQATAWTARVLTGLETELGTNFIHSVRLMSGVSGGSVGVLYFVASYDPQLGAPPLGQLPFINQAAQKSSTESIAQSVAQNELLWLLVPFAYTTTEDRGWAIERSWTHTLQMQGQQHLITERLSDWRAAARTGRMPATVFGATIVETGQPILFSTVDIPSYLQAVIFGKHNSGYAHADIDVVTAVRLSSSFAWASPVAMARYADQDHVDSPPSQLHICDGGYYDSLGVEAAVNWAWDAMQLYRDRLHKIIIVQIRARQESDIATGDEAPMGSFVQSLAPLAASLNALRRAHANRDAVEVQQLIDGSGGLVDTVVLTAENGAKPSWSLPIDSSDTIERDWQSVRQGEQLSKVKQLLKQ